MLSDLSCSLKIISCWKKNCVTAVGITIVSVPLPGLPSLPLPPPLSFHIITMYSPRGWLKGFLTGGEWRKENGGRWQQRRVVLITPCVWKRKGGVEDLFQLINGSLSLSLSLLLPDSSIRDNMSGTDIARSGDHDRNTVVLREAKFHVKPLWSTKRPDSSTSCSIRLIVYRTL